MNPHTLTVNETLNILSTSVDGLSSSEAEKRILQYGENKLKPVKQKNLFLLFLGQFKDFMVLILILAAAISFSVSYIKGQTDYLDPIIILSIIMINAFIGLIQEAKAEHAIEALMKLSSGISSVIRDGTSVQAASSSLVPGDIILLEAGYIVPADSRLIFSNNLSIDESALTGESNPVQKSHTQVFSENTPIAERSNMLFSGCLIVHGHGMAVVTGTGMNTEVGKIASLIQSASVSETPVQKQMTELGKYLGITALAICAFLFIFGVIRGYDTFDMFMTSVSLAVAAIPEGLTAVITIMLSLGVQRMSKKNTIIRNLSSIEMLGAATFICSDKTGTLTENNMSVTDISFFIDNKTLVDSPDSGYTDSFHNLLSKSVLCCDLGIDPTEKAIMDYSSKYNITKKSLEKKYERIDEIPFDSTRKCMITYNLHGNGIIAVMKGATEAVLSHCCTYTDGRRSYQLTEKKISQIQERVSWYSGKALRVIAVAFKISDSRESRKPSLSMGINKFTFLGLIGMIDPPRPTSAPAVSTCRMAGITPVMITGDHMLTALSIGRQIGIPGPAVSGPELDDMTEEEFMESVYKYNIFARVSPEHKVNLVKALKKQGEIVIMTGDGINDAPALKAADIGCAMGISGTDVAKNASDMILTDDNFATIVSAISEGRCIYDNIRGAIHFLLSCNIGEIITILVAIIAGMPSPLLPVQLLWVNLITDSFPAIAIGMAPAEPGIMTRKPQPANNSLFSNFMGLYILIEGMIIGVISLLAYRLSGGTAAFCVLAMSQLFHSFNIYEDYGTQSHSINKKLLATCIFGVLIQIFIINVPFFAEIFHIDMLSAAEWSVVALLSISPLIIVRPLKKLIKYIFHV